MKRAQGPGTEKTQETLTEVKDSDGAIACLVAMNEHLALALTYT